MIKVLLAILLIVWPITIKCPAEEIVIKISGEEYSRQMPENLDDAKALVSELCRMLNTADDELVEMRALNVEQQKSYIASLTKAEEKLTHAEEELAALKKDMKIIDKDTNYFTRLNYRFQPFFMVGPTLNFDDGVHSGVNLGIGGLYRIFGNFHLGAYVNGSVFSGDYASNSNVGVGVMFSYSVR